MQGYVMPVRALRDLCKTPPFARFLRQAQILILEILNVFLWLKFSPSLNSNKNLHFSKVSLMRRQNSRLFPGSCRGNKPGNMPLKANYISSTVIAPGSHTSIQLSQPRHSSALTGTDLPSWISKTSTGQTSTHSSQPSHFSSSTVGIKAI